MKLSPAAEFAVRGALVLAENYGGSPTTLDAICEARGLSKQYLVKIFSSLTRAGLVTPVRGKKGGYLLARDPADICLLQIIEAAEGPIAVNFSQHDPPRCGGSESGHVDTGHDRDGTRSSAHNQGHCAGFRCEPGCASWCVTLLGRGHRSSCEGGRKTRVDEVRKPCRVSV